MSAAIQSLLNLKKWKEDEAKNRFALLLRELDTEEKRLLRLEDKFDSIRKRYECTTDELINIGEIKKLNEYLEHVIAKIEHQKKTITEKEKQVETARNVFVAATKDRKIFERLDEKQRAVLEKEQRRKEQIGTDEHAVTRYKRQ